MISISYVLDQIPKSYIQKFHLSRFDKTIRILPQEETIGTVFEIPLMGSLERDGFEKTLLYLTEGSCILEKKSISYDEEYHLVSGKLAVHGTFVDTVSYCDGRHDGLESMITDTLVESCKVKKVERKR